MKEAKTKGSASIIALVVVALLAIVLVGWAAYQSNDKGETSTSTPSPETTQTPDPDNIPAIETSIENVSETEFIIRGTVTDLFDTREVDGDAGFTIGNEFHIVVDIARENQLMANEPKGDYSQFQIGDVIKAYVQKYTGTNRYTIYGSTNYYVTAEN